MNQESPQGLEEQLAFPDKKPETHQFPKNFRGKYLRKKMGFLGMIISVSCVTNKVKIKITKRIINIMREKRVVQTMWSQQYSVLSAEPLVLDE